MKIQSILLLCASLCASPALAQTSRPFQLASTAIQGFQQNNGVVFQNSWAGFSFPQLAPDVDVISVQPEFLGVPFAQFEKNATLPDDDPWAKQMTALANAAKEPGKPLLVQIALVRANLVGKAVYPDGLVNVEPYWAPSCPDLTGPDFTNLQQSYLNYAMWVAKTFSPKYFVIMLEPNLYFSTCGGVTPSWKVLVKIENAVYRAVKAAYPSMILFPSFNLESIYGLGALYDQDPTGFDQAQYDALLAMKRDRLGLVSFPQLIQNPYKLPLDYYTRIPDRNPNEQKIVLTEVGWNSTTIKVFLPAIATCGARYSEPSFETAFLNLILYSGYVGNFDLITWWSARDELPADVVSACYPSAKAPDFAECNGDVWCVGANVTRVAPPPGLSPEVSELAFKAFGSMGLRAYDGTPKTGPLTLWQQFQQLPIDTTLSPSQSNGQALAARKQLRRD